MLTPCAASLLETLKELAATHPDIKTVYLATDYPIEDLESGRDGLVAHSGTFARLITEDHHRAMRMFLNAFRKDQVGGLQLTTYEREQQAGRVRLPDEAEDGTHTDLAELDSGLIGIVDKNMAMAAEIFITGVSGECGKESSFTRQIVADRKVRLEEQALGSDEDSVRPLKPGELWQDVRVWGLAADEPSEKRM